MRLIPAWAGKTSAVHSLFSASQAHPRVGGENLIGVAADLSAQGSSPRGRGKRFRCSDDRLDLGLIPAWAGKTGSSHFGVWGVVLAWGRGLPDD